MATLAYVRGGRVTMDMQHNIYCSITGTISVGIAGEALNNDLGGLHLQTNGSVASSLYIGECLNQRTTALGIQIGNCWDWYRNENHYE